MEYARPDSTMAGDRAVLVDFAQPERNDWLAAYHQYHAVNKAVEAMVEASATHGDRKAGVVWHTQGSGKSLTMAFYAGKLVRHPAMRNPTLVVLTDRNDLDDQLFGAFAACRDVLRQTPVQASDRPHLRELLRVASGGIVFTTIQKFLPEEGDRQPALSQRENIVFIADEAHRIDLVVADLVRHAVQRMEALDGKVMIVCMSRAICVKLYDAIVLIVATGVWRADDHDGGGAGAGGAGTAAGGAWRCSDRGRWLVDGSLRARYVRHTGLGAGAAKCSPPRIA